MYIPDGELTWDVLLCAGAAGDLNAVRGCYNAYLDTAEALCSSGDSGGEVFAPGAELAAGLDSADEAVAAAIAAAGDMSLALQRCSTMLGQVTSGARAPLAARTLVSIGGSLKEMAERIKAEKKTSKFDILSLGKGMASAISCPCCFPGAEGDATRVEFAHLLRGWVDGPGVQGCDARALAAMDAVLEVCEAMPRFCVGDKVELNADGEKYSRGQIVAHWWRHPTWEADAPAAIYQVQLEDDGGELGGELIFATKDIDACLRAV